jgi:hypothetical protein
MLCIFKFIISINSLIGHFNSIISLLMTTISFLINDYFDVKKKELRERESESE